MNNKQTSKKTTQQNNIIIFHFWRPVLRSHVYPRCFSPSPGWEIRCPRSSCCNSSVVLPWRCPSPLLSSALHPCGQKGTYRKDALFFASEETGPHGNMPHGTETLTISRKSRVWPLLYKWPSVPLSKEHALFDASVRWRAIHLHACHLSPEEAEFFRFWESNPGLWAC